MDQVSLVRFLSFDDFKNAGPQFLSRQNLDQRVNTNSEQLKLPKRSEDFLNHASPEAFGVQLNTNNQLDNRAMSFVDEDGFNVINH